MVWGQGGVPTRLFLCGRNLRLASLNIANSPFLINSPLSSSCQWKIQGSTSTNVVWWSDKTLLFCLQDWFIVLTLTVEWRKVCNLPEIWPFVRQLSLVDSYVPTNAMLSDHWSAQCCMKLPTMFSPTDQIDPQQINSPTECSTLAVANWSRMQGNPLLNFWNQRKLSSIHVPQFTVFVINFEDWIQ